MPHGCPMTNDLRRKVECWTEEGGAKSVPAKVFDGTQAAPEMVRIALSAAVTPRYWASSKIEKPLRSEFANKMRSWPLAKLRRSGEKTAPTLGRAMACPNRMMSI